MDTTTKKISIYRRLLGYLRPYRGRFILSLVCMGLYGATDGAVPLIIRSVLDDIFGAHDKEKLELLLVVLVAFGVIRGGLGFFQQYIPATVGLDIVRDLRNQINQHLLMLSPGNFGRHTSGSLTSRMTNDTLLVRAALNDAVTSVLKDSIRVVALICTALYLDPTLGLIAFVGVPLAIVPVIRFGKKVRRLSKVGQNQFGGLTSALQETILGHKVVQGFTMERFEQEKFERENNRFTETLARAEKYGAMSGPINELVACIAIAGVVLYGALSVMGGVRTQGDFIAFITALFLMYEPVKKLGRVNTLIQSGVAAAERIFEVIDEVPEIVEAPDAKPLVVRTPRIDYIDVSFRYPSGYQRALVDGSPGESETSDVERSWALDNVSLSIGAGQTLALVGMSGGGKSTVANLLPRFFDPQRGQVLIDGQDVRGVTLESLRRSIAIVSQHAFLFNDTVYNNIAYGRPDASEAEVMAAADAAHAHVFIGKLPQGYQTIVGEQGMSLSGGERARLTIARALLKNAPILILDEATAALDSESEELVQSAIDRLMQGRTTIVIAHRLATIRKAEKIAVLVSGKVVEYGTHQELLERGGEYSKLYRIQFRDQSLPNEQISADSQLRKVSG